MNTICRILLIMSVCSLLADAFAGPCPFTKGLGVKASLRTIRPIVGSVPVATKGIPNTFCVFQSGEDSAMVDPSVLKSHAPSIAGTYIRRGINIDAINQIPGALKDGNIICNALEASSIFLEIGGNFPGPFGPKFVCVFGDGSKVGADDLIKVSQDPSYLGLRSVVTAPPLNTELPYQAPLTTTPRNNVVFIKAGFPSTPDGWSFTWSQQVSYTKGQPFDPSTGVNSVPIVNGGVEVLVVVGRQNSSGPAQWYQSQLSNPNSIHTDSGSTYPAKLNFAITGTLTLNGSSYSIALGQGSNSTALIPNNNWWLGGTSAGYQYLANYSGCRSGPALVTPDSAYVLCPNSNNGFSIYNYTPN